MQLSKLLAARGFVITFVNSEYNTRRMLQAHQEQKIADTGLDIRLVGIPDGLPSSHDRNPLSFEFVMSLERIGDEFDKFVENLLRENVHITCIISDSFLIWTRQIANKWKIPRVSFWPNSMSVFTCSLYVPEIMCSGYNPFQGEVNIGDSADPVTCIPGLSPFPHSALPFKTLDGEGSAQWLYTHIIEQFTHLEQARCIIVNSFHELERNVCEHHLQVRPPKVFLLGPLLPSAFLAAGEQLLDTAVGACLNDEDECMEWLDTQEASSVLYISLGSIATMSAQEIEEMAVGLARSKQPFLWVLRAESNDEAQKAIAQAWPDGWASMERQGKIIRWAAQLRVLSHRAVGGFLTHSGWNSTLESISMGVPMIGWPKFMDQLTNCWFVENEWKVGLKLEGGDRQEVEKAVRLLMQEQAGKEMRARVSQLQMTARSAFNGSSHKALESFIDCILEEASHAQSVAREV